MSEIYSLHRLTLAAADEHLFAALSVAIPGLSRHQARLAIKGGLVKVDGVTIQEPKHQLGASANVLCDLRQGIQAAYHARVHGAAPPQEKPFVIIHQDTHLVVVDKAVGIVSAPSHQPGQLVPERGHVPELLRRVFRKRGQDIGFIGIVHRLDKETSGCLCFALTKEAQRLMAAQFATHAAGRVYRCYTMRTPKRREDTIRGALTRDDDGRRVMVQDEEAGKEMITHFRVLRSFKAKDGRDLGAELEVRLETGRTHQIRVTLGGIGCPIYGDTVYAHRAMFAPGAPPPPTAPRMMLHAHTLSFDHPISGKRVEVEAPIPAAFTEFAQRLT